MGETKRINLIVYGLVHGVGFRVFIARTAKELNICGWVRNLPDGSVEIEAQGTEEMLEELRTTSQLTKESDAPESNNALIIFPPTTIGKYSNGWGGGGSLTGSANSPPLRSKGPITATLATLARYGVNSAHAAIGCTTSFLNQPSIGFHLGATSIDILLNYK